MGRGRRSPAAAGLAILVAWAGQSCAPPARPPARPPAPEVRAPADSGRVEVPLAVDSLSTRFPPATGFPEVSGEGVERVLGLLVPVSGRYAGYGETFLDGARLALEESAALAPFAPPVGLRVEDTAGDAFTALAAARRLAARPEVVALVGCVLNLPTVVVGVEANCQQIPLLSTVASEERVDEIGPWVVHTVASRRSEGEAAAELALFRLRCDRAALLHPEDLDGRHLAAGFSGRFTNGGGRIVASESYPPGTTDFTPLLRRLRDARPDVLYLALDAEDARLVLPALAFQGLEVPVVGTQTWSIERLVAAVGVDLEGVYVPRSGAGLGDAAATAFEARYRERYGRVANRFAAAGYEAVRRLWNALADLPEADRTAVREALRSMGPGPRDATPAGFRFEVVRQGRGEDYGRP